MILNAIRNLLFPTKMNSAKVLNPREFKTGITSGKSVLLDVRTKREFEQGHIEGARNLDIFHVGKFQSQCELLNRDEPVYLYCRSGNRSRKASRILANMGFKEIYDLRGGILNWYKS